ncbi:hypothetical protein DB347_22720 [Opitutaceae bacterium EW11]|nr:hypothetical protein DB347_22720 [Opitutaceae bacterium EW11]
MRTFVLVVFMLVSCVAAGASESRSITLEDWTITIPSDFKVRTARGSDFTVTYFEAPNYEIMIGFYVGHPSEAAASEPAAVRKEADRIGGEDVTWWVWTEKVEAGDTLSRAQVVLRGQARKPRPGKEEMRFFLVAQNDSMLTRARDIVRTLKIPPNQSLEPTPTAVTPRACARVAPAVGVAQH